MVRSINKRSGHFDGVCRGAVVRILTSYLAVLGSILAIPVDVKVNR